MSYSRGFVRFRIKINVFVIRFIGWIRSGDIKKNRNKGELLKAEILTNYYARKYLPSINNLTQQKQTSVENPETIWQFWDNPAGRTTPEIVKASIESVNKFKGNFDQKVLNNSTIKNYSNLPGYVFDKFNGGLINYAHFSDLLRLNLLKNHGGIWMDATAYMTDFIPRYIVNEDFFVFLTDNLTGFPYSFVQNCFIRSKKGSLLCEMWYRMCVEFWKDEKKILDYFQHQLIFKALILNNTAAKNLFSKMPRKSDDQIHRLKLFGQFDVTEWEKIKKESFFQKTTYKVPGDAAAGAKTCPGTYFSKLCEGNM